MTEKGAEKPAASPRKRKARAEPAPPPPPVKPAPDVEDVEDLMFVDADVDADVDEVRAGRNFGPDQPPPGTR